jgi:protein-L-isoaspartate O-methyltransferase
MNMMGDVEFDELLPERYRSQSTTHFTPVHVSRRATQLLDKSSLHVLDVGAGVGKFCSVAAAFAPKMKFTGVERRADLHAVAEQIRVRYRLHNLAFVHGDAFALDWDAFDAFYLFNPFAELRPPRALPVGEHSGELARPRSSDASDSQYRAAVDRAQDRLARARAGTRVVTYHGFGAPVPADYELLAMEVIGTDRLQLWEKRG